MTSDKPTFDGTKSKFAVEISNIRKTFNGKDFVLDGINLEIPVGQIAVIIGYSGTGKSVLLKLILGLLKPTSGSIKILGQEITKMNDRQLKDLRQHYGVLFQDSALFDDLSALGNVIFPLKEHRPDLSESQMIQIAREKLKDSGLDEIHYKKMPSEMSDGMRKRVGLARAIVLNPEIIIYDEPTTSLDPVLTDIINKLIVTTERLTKKTTSIVVSHDLFGAFGMADSITMLNRGKVLLHGSPKEFRNSKIELVQQFVSTGLHLETSCV